MALVDWEGPNGRVCGSCGIRLCQISLAFLANLPRSNKGDFLLSDSLFSNQPDYLLCPCGAVFRARGRGGGEGGRGRGERGKGGKGGSNPPLVVDPMWSYTCMLATYGPSCSTTYIEHTSHPLRSTLSTQGFFLGGEALKL